MGSWLLFLLVIFIRGRLEFWIDFCMVLRKKVVVLFGLSVFWVGPSCCVCGGYDGDSCLSLFQ